ncbi:MAG: hypothetical protein AAF960_28405 [Bacteroidota bacterium]
MDWMNELVPSLRIILIVVISGFVPFTAMSFFMVVIPQKEKEFTKSIKEMGISTSRRVRDSYSVSRYLFPVLFAFLIFFGFITAFAFGGSNTGFNDNIFLSGPFFGTDNPKVVAQSFSVLAWAFAGGFIWSAYNIIRRLVAYDLSPSVYYSAGIRIILASAVALVLSFLLGSETSNNEVVSFKSSLAAIAFLAGIFPQRILNYIIKRYQEFVSSDSVTDKSLSLYNIEGISIYHKERLEEIGIDNAQNLATASLTQLIAETPYDARQLLDWIGQAKLVCYVKQDIHRLRAIGIRSVFDLLKGNKSKIVLREIADAVGLETPILEVVHAQVKDDQGINALYNFQENKNSPTRDVIATAVVDNIDFTDPKEVEAKG